jgi:hypothetical protein
MPLAHIEERFVFLVYLLDWSLGMPILHGALLRALNVTTRIQPVVGREQAGSAVRQALTN